jgi:hypothetical protein
LSFLVLSMSPERPDELVEQPESSRRDYHKRPNQHKGSQGVSMGNLETRQRERQAAGRWQEGRKEFDAWFSTYIASES